MNAIRRTSPRCRAAARLAAGLGLLWLVDVPAADWISENVRTTPWQAATQQLQSFRLPPGFEIQLVAHEPDINKPMNLAFDAAGRLWVTTSLEYPFAAPTNKPGRDRVMIFEDFGPDGRARKVTEFAGGLNIPIGIYPFYSPASGSLKRSSVEALKGNAPGRPAAENGSTVQRFNASTNTWKCLVWSIPFLWLMEDTDGDGRADKREPLYGPFDHTRDTHGNQASFRRGFDGWLYCTHGFNNDSRVKGRDGHEVHLNSGNCYRLRLDGARLEHHTHGQVNPFGLAFDPFGNLYSSDCHSEPIYQLLAGGYYPSFGKPDDGLGFAPKMMEKPRGSTAIDAVSYYADDLWPEEFRDNIFIGDVMASAVFRDRTVERGATRIARPMPDFVQTRDPWFRPVDTCLGPDGALYIADFYNRIIGHYEVPLSHPGRDRTSGRIWRVVYQGAEGKARLRPAALPADLNGLMGELASPSLTRRLLAMNAIADRFGAAAAPALRQAVMLDGNAPDRVAKNSSGLLAHVLWLLARLEQLDDPSLVLAASHPDPLVRVHVLRIVTERGRERSIAPRREADRLLPLSLTNLVFRSLADTNALAQRCAAEALGNFPAYENIQPLLALLQRVPKEDTHLLYVVRKALRDQLVPEENFTRLAAAKLSDADARAVADVALAVKSAAAGAFLLRHAQTAAADRDALGKMLRHAARYAPESSFDSLAHLARGRFAGDLDLQFALFKSVQEGAAERGLELRGAVRGWGSDLATQTLAPATPPASAWVNTPLDGAPDSRRPWAFQERPCADGQRAQLMSSHPLGEQLTGVFRSAPFALPPRLRFYLAGHDGFPDKPAQRLNVVRLRDAETRAVLREVFPPRNDTAQRISWDLGEFAGRRGFLEVTDADTAGAYAWLAFGRFEPALPELALGGASQTGARQQAAADIARALRLAGLEPPLARLLADPAADADARVAAGRALATLNPAAAVPALARIVSNATDSVTLREKFATPLAEVNSPAAHEALLAALRAAPGRFQLKLAAALAGTEDGAEQLLAAVEGGKAPAFLLQDRAVRDRLKAAKPRDAEARLARLTKDLQPLNEQLVKLVEQRRKAFDAAKASATEGARVFTQTCAACHSLGGQGGNVGPQLDGIGARGLERLCEDILDPNRNLDHAFRTTVLVLKDGDVQSGLFRREEGALLVLADSTGKEITVPKAQVAERRETETSLMPENFSEVIPPEDFNHLLAFLLAKGLPAAGQ